MRRFFSLALISLTRLFQAWAALLFAVSSTFAQSTIEGKVTDSSGAVVAGVNVSVKGTTNFTVTNKEGRFSIVAPAASTLEFSHVGFEMAEVVAGNQTEIAVSLRPSITVLDELVVVGYGTQQRKDLTGAVSPIQEKDFNKGNFTSPDQLIQGRAAGVQITNNSGQPGIATTIKIRGNSVIAGTGQPLFVVDGVPLSGISARPNTDDGDSPAGNPLNFLNVNDIASIDVLKDASAASIYGSRAAYGVVMITTKKGQAGEPKIDFAASMGLSSIQRTIKVLNATQYREAIPYYGVNPAIDKGGDADGLGSILRTARQQNYSLGVSGGNSNGKYRFSFGYYDQEGILSKSEIKKYNVGLSASLKFLDSKKLSLDINSIANQNQESIPWIRNGGSIAGAGLRWNPTEPLRDSTGAFVIRPNEFNPLAYTELHDDNIKVTSILASLAPRYEFTDWLDFKVLASVNYGSGVRRYSFNDALDPNFHIGTANVNNNETLTTQVTSALNFHKEILADLNVSALAGFEYMNFNSKGTLIGVRAPLDPSGQSLGFGNYGLDYTNYVQYSNPTNRSVASFADPITELQSYIGRAVFNYKRRYLLTTTFRADGSTKFGVDNKYGYFPSFSAAWIASEEDFFGMEFISLLKLRAGWGKTGNQEFPAGAATTLYGFSNNGVIYQINNPNPQLKWQSDQQFNIGLDFAVLKNRISGTVDYFQKTTTDLLFPNYPIQPAPPNSAVTWVNLDGRIQNTGLEVTFNSTLVERKNVSWNFGVNATFIKNNVSGLSAPIQTGYATSGALVEVIQNGMPINTFYTRKFLGLDSKGVSTFQDDGYTLHNVGNPNPTTLLGINTLLQVRKFSLTVNMYGAFGQSVYHNTRSNLLNTGNILFGSNILLSEFRSPIKESLANPVQASSRYVERADYLKMGNATFAYNFGRVGKAFKQARVYFTAQNVFTITNYSGFNPEVNIASNNNGIPSLGIDNQAYPVARTLIIGFNFSL